MAEPRLVTEKKQTLIKALEHLDLTEELVNQIGNLVLAESKHQLAVEETLSLDEKMNREKIRRLQNLTWTRW